MNNYEHVICRFWLYPGVQQLTVEAKLVALYILTVPRQSVWDKFHFCTSCIEKYLCLSKDVVAKCLLELKEIDFIEGCSEPDVVTLICRGIYGYK